MATSSPKLPEDRSPFDDQALVRLRSVVGTDAGVLLPGALGTIVYRHDGGDAYEVEFSDPIALVVTLRGGDLSPAA
ncbi:DUF4926 domain-containing protein [Sphingomonas sp. RP10(2022)]|uniref:DUF4926 domain-containing protein n=1 Tax=Sphingomonas liriopis TaxID=2949094 RepID=A0A9X2HV68_9SPHN|nr:DUF4926 domain-containing protein [Sphingomonas liriopis]MCP3733280.1 DUF4926 domain-containing protein [Sphingomonas liriopis]